MGKAYTFLFGQCTTGLQHRIEAKAKYESKIKGDPIKLLETIKELSFNDKKKADIVTINAIMNLMTTRQKDDEDLTKYTKCFKAARDLCKEKYGGILNMPTLAQRESKWLQDSIYKFLIRPVSQEHGSNKVWFIHQEDGRRLCHRPGECLPNPHRGCTTHFVHPQI